ncbi:MAG: T9SS type A sorting domain-containing protein [Crocinitomicaceae bacterium]|nr:T9SS type A sorting domain-containing protein [Crocinitomicaceae bacterium]
MKNKLLLIALAISLFTNAQNTINQVFILNEGYFDYTANQLISPATLGSYNPTSQVYSVVDTLDGARFASDMIIDNNHLYVAADNKLYKYDKNNYSLLASQQIDGIRNLAVWNDKIIVTRGDYDNVTFAPILFNAYLQVYNTSDLGLHTEIDTVSGPKWSTQNVIVEGDNAYIAVNNAYEWGNYKGIVGILDLNNFSYGNEIDLGINGTNPDNMLFLNGFIYTVNNKDFSGSSVSKIDLSNNQLSSTVDIALANTGCGTSSLKDDKLIYQISQETTLNEFDINLMNNIGPLNNYNQNYYCLSQNPVNGNLYSSNTDFASYGKVYIYDTNNVEISNFEVGISPGTIRFDVVSSAGINETTDEISFYPNPSNKQLNLSSEFNGTIEVINLLGKKIMTMDAKNITEINISNLKNGKYMLKFIKENQLNSFKSFVKF